MIGILGGTFDPIHQGHIEIADAALKALALFRVEIIPCYQPPHRQKPVASPEDRFAMAKLAAQPYPAFHVNDIELKREGISYSIDTLTELRKQLPQQSLCLLLGADVFTHFNTWREWKKIAEIVHLIIMGRPDAKRPHDPEMQTLIQKNKTIELSDLQKFPGGKIYYLNNKLIAISATQIRSALQSDLKNIAGLDPQVANYIAAHKLYSIR